jgi:hypothetical protein
VFPPKQSKNIDSEVNHRSANEQNIPKPNMWEIVYSSKYRVGYFNPDRFRN